MHEPVVSFPAMQQAAGGIPAGVSRYWWWEETVVGALRFVAALALALVAAAPAGAQDENAPASPQRQFTLGLDVLYSPRYEAQRELRLGLWDSPMSRLEFTVAREIRAARHPGPTGIVTPMSRIELPVRLGYGSAVPGGLLFGPWSPGWQDLDWSEKVAAGAQAAVIVTLFAQAIHHLK